MNNFIEKIYFSCPVFIQNVLISLYGYKLYKERYIGNHDADLDKLLNSQWYSKDIIELNNNENFMRLFHYAIKHVPYYKNLVNEGKIDPLEIKSILDIEKLPILSKEDIRRNTDLFISDEYNKNDLIAIGTSGTTGKTLNIYVSKESRRYAYAFFSRFKRWAKLDSRKNNVTFAGRTIIPTDSPPPFWRKNLISNNYLFSSYHLTDNNFKLYIDGLNKVKPHYIDSYPSSIYILAKYIKENNLSIFQPKAIITSSETLFDSHRELIEEVFQCPIFDQYGSAEQVAFVSQCEAGTYHIHPEFGHIEFVNAEGKAVSPGASGRLICTGYTNQAMPLIRYDIGDTGILSDDTCSCGRNFPVIKKIIGRTDDILIMEDGREVGRLDPVFKGLKSIKEAQIIQQDYSFITLRIIPDENFSDKDGDAVVSELKKRLGENVHIDIDIVDRIERTKSGKFRSVISKVKRNN